MLYPLGLRNVYAWALLIVAVSAQAAAAADVPVFDGSWTAYARDSGGMRHSPLTQIDRENVHQLRPAWSYRTGEMEKLAGGRSSRKAAFECTPLVVDGVLYLSTPTGRVIALDPETGDEKWQYDPQVDLKLGYSELTSRGVSTWVPQNAPDAKTGGRRIYIATINAQLIALDAATGEPCPDFGEQGTVYLWKDIGRVDPGNYQVTSPPAVLGDLVVVGSTIGDNGRFDMERGVVRAFDARSGELRWSWDPIPRKPGDPGAETWRGAKAARTGAANAWSIISADAGRDLVFVPTSCPSPDYYGGERLGSNLFANSVVALQASTGRIVWHYQVVHHDIWDYDVPAQPLLFDLRKNGESIPAVAIGTKMGYIFVLHRETGEPLFPVEEREVPASDVAGEDAAPTQPTPTVLPALGLHEMTADDAFGATPDERQQAKDRIESLRYEGIYTPPSLQGSLITPSNVGGLNWSGMTFDPARQLLVTNVNRLAAIIQLIPRDKFAAARGERLGAELARQAGTPYGMSREIFRHASGMPATPPPWGTLAAIDLNTGKLSWEVPLGSVVDPSAVPPAAEWGSPSLGGATSTAGGLVFVAGTLDHHLRAFDVETGKELWKSLLPAGGNATPMTYQLRPDGKQYVVICAGGHGKLGTKLGDHVVAFTLP